jgi:thymidylate synthase (FAD)
MKLIDSNVEIVKQGHGLIDMYKHIERCGRLCYKSEDKITDTSYEAFIEMLRKNQHLSVLEHGTVYLDFTDEWPRDKYVKNPYSKVYKNTLENNWSAPHLYVTTNMRVVIENDWLNDLKYLCKPTKYHERRYTFLVTTSRGISHELVRHRACSFSQVSQRYVSYKNKDIEFIRPYWINDEFTYEMGQHGIKTTNLNLSKEETFINSCINAESHYKYLLSQGCKPQEAREVLPNATATQLYMTGTIPQWKHFLKLRLAKTAHPDARKIAYMIKSLLESEGVNLSELDNI